MIASWETNVFKGEAVANHGFALTNLETPKDTAQPIALRYDSTPTMSKDGGES